MKFQVMINATKKNKAKERRIKRGAILTDGQGRRL